MTDSASSRAIVSSPSERALAASSRTASSTSTKAPAWAYTPVTRPAIPAVKDKAWVRTPLDAHPDLRQRGLASAAASPVDVGVRLAVRALLRTCY